MNELKKTDVRLYGYLKNCTFNQTSDNSAELIFSSNDAVFAHSLERLNKKETVCAALSEKTGKDISLTVKCETAVQESGSDKVEKALEGFLSKDKIEII